MKKQKVYDERKQHENQSHFQLAFLNGKEEPRILVRTLFFSLLIILLPKREKLLLAPKKIIKLK